MQKAVILIAEGDAALFQDLKGLLFRQGYEIITASNRTNLLQGVRNGSSDLVILGPWAESAWEGLEAAQEIRGWDKKIPLILIAMNSSEELAIAALRAGINDYFRRPFSAEEIAASVERCLAKLAPSKPLANHETSTADLIPDGRLISQSPSMQGIKSYLLRVATTDSTILITGETGTGKELVAELIHSNSLRCKKPFVCINCAALPDSLLESELFGYERGAFTGAVARQRGKFELADEGIIFLDEIGEMSLGAQTKMLRTIENKEIYRLGGSKNVFLNVRIIAATNQDPERLVAEEKFRKDLYFRLNMVRIHLPPLRERQEDIPHLLEHFLQELNQRFGRSVEGFTKRPWPICCATIGRATCGS
ncbi:MAG: sigma-54-dependent transcriptional regulator [Candidatus Binatia bacterium]